MKEKWELRQKVNDVESLAKEILKKRGFEEKEVESFLNPKLKDLKNPYMLKDMDKVVGRIFKAINLDENILVYGDYDTDGITSTALLLEVLNDLGADVGYYIPNRLDEGYGMDKEKVKELATKFSLIITVDNGITAVDEVDIANSLGSDVIVIDHHTPNEQLPNAHSIINPDNDLAGVGLVLKTIQALGGNIEKNLAITSLGTIGDMVKLKRENRILAKKGLENFEGFNLDILAKALEKENPSGQDISFYLSPAINSCGRLGNADLAVDFLLEENEEKAKEKAEKIVEMNDERRKRSKKIMKRIEKVSNEFDNFLFVALEDAHKGVIGSSASKLMYKHFKPTFLLSKEEEYSTGSVRVPEDISFNVAEFLQNNSALFEKFGGHENAGGFTIDNDFLPVLKKKLKKATSHLTSKDFEKKIIIDKKLEVNDIDRDVIKELKKLAPFGEGNPEPVFGAKKDLKVKSSFTISNNSHVMGKFETKEGKMEMDFVGWGMGNQLDKFRTSNLAVVYVPEINTYRGANSLRMKIESAKSLTSVEDKDKKQKDKGRSFYTKLTGVTYGNRQETIKKEVSIGDKISLKRDFDNDHDKNATYVLVSGEEIGYLRRELARNIAPKLDKGIKFTGEVVNITGQNYKNRGVNIKLKEIS